MSQTSLLERFEVKNLLKQPGEGEETATHLTIKARARDMGGDFSVMEGVINPQELLAPHTHKFEDQLVYVITSELVFELGGADGLRFTAPAGSYVQKPRGIMHAFWNITDTPARYIELSGKDGFEGFVDSQKQGAFQGTKNAERDWGMIWNLEELIRLMKENKLTSLAAMDTEHLASLPNLPESVAKMFRNLN
ncbi:MAG: cupin domain-containing protein [Symploca sp. SIO2E6]|nr:cupin domain-containing protein [Symploca sp. SIO2E6]